MNPTHVHLIITHLPVFGSVLGAIVLAQGLLTKSNQTKIAAYNVLIISAIGAAIAYLTGESAEDTVETISGVSKNAINAHEEFALFAFISMVALGLSAIFALWVSLRRTAWATFSGSIVLLIALVSFGLIAWTSYLGGQIRHTEISAAAAPSGGRAENNDD